MVRTVPWDQGAALHFPMRMYPNKTPRNYPETKNYSVNLGEESSVKIKLVMHADLFSFYGLNKRTQQKFISPCPSLIVEAKPVI